MTADHAAHVALGLAVAHEHDPHAARNVSIINPTSGPSGYSTGQVQPVAT
jgi:hypothetical protein